MAKYPAKFDFGQKPSIFGYKTTFGPGGYTVYRVLTDSAGDIYNSSIADFAFRTHAELFLRALRKKEREEREKQREEEEKNSE
tara:strand:+ start:1324 stop:1572 length:249 start_codon:yes stop_codon:yes gene_type:complete